jgi:hypothetical protein
MTAVREAIGLPLLFLTVALLAGVRIGPHVVLATPSVYALILGILLLRLFVQSGALAPERLLSSRRTALENVNGAVLLLAFWAAGAQTCAMLIPDAGLPRLILNVFFLILLLNTAAANPDRRRLLRSLGVTFGSAFLLKYVVLSELSSPGTGWTKRVLQAMLQGITLGTLIQEVLHPATAYIALFALLLFLVGAFLLPYRQVPLTTDLARRTTINAEAAEDAELTRATAADVVGRAPKRNEP